MSDDKRIKKELIKRVLYEVQEAENDVMDKYVIKPVGHTNFKKYSDGYQGMVGGIAVFHRFIKKRLKHLDLNSSPSAGGVKWERKQLLKN